MRSRLGMSAYYKKKEGGGQDLSPCPGGSGTNTLTYLLRASPPSTCRVWLLANKGYSPVLIVQP